MKYCGLRHVNVNRHTRQDGIEWILEIDPYFEEDIESCEIHIGEYFMKLVISCHGIKDAMGKLIVSTTKPLVPAMFSRLRYFIHKYRAKNIPIKFFSLNAYQNERNFWFESEFLPEHLENVITEDEKNLGLQLHTVTVYPPIYIEELRGDISPTGRKYGQFDELMLNLSMSKPLVPREFFNKKAVSLSTQNNWCIIYPSNLPDRDRIIQEIDPLVKHRNGIITPIESGVNPKDIINLLNGLLNTPLEKRPYYMLILGDFDMVSPECQYLLSTIGAAGRLAFSQSEDYGKYARKVIDFERKLEQRVPDVTYIASDYDDINRINYSKIVYPLLSDPQLSKPENVVSNGRASKERVLSTIQNIQSQNILFVSAHGFEHLNFGNYSNDQIYKDMYEFQGSLILDDFHDGHLLGSTDGLLCAKDVYNIPIVPGGIIILHACYSAGTVDRETMPEWIHLGMPPRIIPPKNFVGNLTKALLCNPEGPLGIYAHINRSHQYDYFHPGNKGDSSTYIQYSHMIKSLLDGGTIGISRERARKYTLDYLHQIVQAIDIVRRLLAKLTRTGNLSEGEMNILEGNERALFNYSMAAFNFRNYVILGDPIVRIRKGIKE